MAVIDWGRPLSRGVGRALYLGAALSGLACEAPLAVTPPVTPAPAVAAGDKGVKGFGQGASVEVSSLRFGLKIPLPDGASWRVDDKSGSWLLARNAGAASELLVRVWREEEVMNRGRCEERARFGRKLPERQSMDSVEKHAVGVPAEFDTVVEVGVIAPALEGKKVKPGQDLRGVAMAFGGKGRRCFAWVYVTSAGGSGAEAVLGDRLATMVQESLGRIGMINELELQIERGPSP